MDGGCESSTNLNNSTRVSMVSRDLHTHTTTIVLELKRVRRQVMRMAAETYLGEWTKQGVDRSNAED